MGKAITTLIILAVLIAGGIWLFNKNSDNLAREGVATSTVNYSGTGGPDQGYDPLENINNGEANPDSKG